MYHDSEQCQLNPFYEYQQYPVKQVYQSETHDYGAVQPQVSIQSSQDINQGASQHVKPGNSDARLLRPRYMSHTRSRSDPNFAIANQNKGQVQTASFTPLPNEKTSYHSHYRSPSDPALNLTKENEPTVMPLVDIESNDMSTPHWNPFSPFYESNEQDFLANPSDVTDDDFASLRESGVKKSQVGANMTYHQPNTGNPPTSDLHQGTDVFGASAFGSHLPQNASAEFADGENSSAQFKNDAVSTTIDPQQYVAQIVQEGNNPFLQGYRTSEIKQHLNLADQASSDSEPEESTELAEYPPLSPGFSDPFGAAPFVIQKGKQVPHDAFGSAPFSAPAPSQPKSNKKQSTRKPEDVHQSKGHSFGLSSQFPPVQAGAAVGGSVNNFGSTPFHELNEDVGNPAPFVENVEREGSQGAAFEDQSGLVNPAADFMDNLEDPFGGVSFDANPAVKRRNARKQQGLRKEAPVSTARSDQAPRARPRRLLPQTPEKPPGVTRPGQQARVQGPVVISVGSSSQGTKSSDPKSTGNRPTYAAT